MLYYLILCRSLTYAQRTAAALMRAGISARALRSPKQISEDGCSHSVRIARRDLESGLEILRRAELTPKRVFAAVSDGSYMEIPS